MQFGRRQIVRLLILAAIFFGSAGMQAVAARLFAPAAAAIIPPSGYGYRTTPEQAPTPPEGATSRLLRWLQLEGANTSAINFVTRAALFSSTGLMSLWFVVGGIPRRRNNQPLISLRPTSDRVRVFETPRLHLRKNDTFLRAYQDDAASAPASAYELRKYVPPTLTSSTAAIMELMSEPAHQTFRQHDPHEVLRALDAAITRATENDEVILAEVERYAHELLGKVQQPTQTATGSISAAPVDEVAAPKLSTEEPEPEPALAPASHPAIESTEQEFSVAASEQAMATQPRRMDDDDVLGLSELSSLSTHLQPAALAIEELFNAVSTVESATEARVDPFDLMQCEIAPVPEKPYIAEEVAIILQAEMLSQGALQPATAARRATPAVPPVEPGPLFEQRIIILGDSDAVLEVEKRIVISAGARVITFRRFGDAVVFADEKDFDLLLVNGMTEDGFSATKIYEWLAANRPGWEGRSAFALSAPDPAADDFAARTGAWCIVHPFGPKELVSFLRAVVTPPDDASLN